MVKFSTSLPLGIMVAIGVESASLGAYNVDPTSVSTSGLSAGGFMAVQLGVAYSSIYQTGFGVFAGGPFDCARAQSVCCPYLRNALEFPSPGNNPVPLTATVHRMHGQ